MTGSPRPEWLQVFWECTYCGRRLHIDDKDDGFYVWPSTDSGMPDSCPRCDSADTYVEQARIVLVRVIYSFGFLQWTADSGWSMVLEVNK